MFSGLKLHDWWVWPKTCIADTFLSAILCILVTPSPSPTNAFLEKAQANSSGHSTSAQRGSFSNISSDASKRCDKKVCNEYCYAWVKAVLMLQKGKYLHCATSLSNPRLKLSHSWINGLKLTTAHFVVSRKRKQRHKEESKLTLLAAGGAAVNCPIVTVCLFPNFINFCAWCTQEMNETRGESFLRTKIM